MYNSIQFYGSPQELDAQDDMGWATKSQGKESGVKIK